MAERTILVCDVCGKAADETVTVKTRGGNFIKDLCATHVGELTKGARRPKRGRRPGSKTATAAQGTTAPRRRGRPRKAAA